MPEDATRPPDGGAPAGPACPWCSASLPDPEAAACPACGARLVEPELDKAIPGLTSLDPEAKTRGIAGRRSRLSLGSILIGGGVEAPPAEDELQAVAPPDPDVRLEMLRLEFQAKLAQLEGEAQAIASEHGQRLPPLGLKGAAAEDDQEPLEAPLEGDATTDEDAVSSRAADEDPPIA